jgi:hypothetical protein
MVDVVLTSIALSLFFVALIGSCCIKNKYYERTDAYNKKHQSYKPLLDDSFTDRVV